MNCSKQAQLELVVYNDSCWVSVWRSAPHISTCAWSLSCWSSHPSCAHHWQEQDNGTGKHLEWRALCRRKQEEGLSNELWAHINLPWSTDGISTSICGSDDLDGRRLCFPMHDSFIVLPHRLWLLHSNCYYSCGLDSLSNLVLFGCMGCGVNVHYTLLNGL